MTITAVRSDIDGAVRRLAQLADDDVGMVPGWLAYLAESIESEIGEGWLYDLETIIRDRRERGRW